MTSNFNIAETPRVNLPADRPLQPISGDKLNELGQEHDDTPSKAVSFVTNSGLETLELTSEWVQTAKVITQKMNRKFSGDCFSELCSTSLL